MSSKNVLETAAIELSTYPILTRDVSADSTSLGFSRGGDTSELALKARQAFRHAIGWQNRGSDSITNVKTFQAALSKAFTGAVVEGRTEYTWTPQSYSVQADLGEITGAQASIYKQAKTLIDQVLPLLDKLQPLRPDSDPENIESLRSILRSEINELLSEFGRSEGPRVPKVDQYFCEFFAAPAGQCAPTYDPADRSFGGQLARFARRLGMSERQVNTVVEEVVYTDFLVFTDYLAALHRAWLARRRYFTDGNALFLGTRLSLLSRRLDVIGESVLELRSALDSVYIGPAEIEVVDLDSEAGYANLVFKSLGENPRNCRTLTVGDLLDWIQTFARDEGRRLLQEGGKDGAHTFANSVCTLARWLQKLAEQAAAEAPSVVDGTGRTGEYPPNAGLGTGRVRRAIAELLGHLKNAARLAETNFRAVLANDEHREPFPPDTMATAGVRERIPKLEDAYEVTECLVSEFTLSVDIKKYLVASVKSVGEILQRICPVLDEFDQGRYKDSNNNSLNEPLETLASGAITSAAAAKDALPTPTGSSKARGPKTSAVSYQIDTRPVDAVIELASLAYQLVEMTEKLVPRK